MQSLTVENGAPKLTDRLVAQPLRPPAFAMDVLYNVSKQMSVSGPPSFSHSQPAVCSVAAELLPRADSLLRLRPICIRCLFLPSFFIGLTTVCLLCVARFVSKAKAVNLADTVGGTELEKKVRHSTSHVQAENEAQGNQRQQMEETHTLPCVLDSTLLGESCHVE